MKSFFKKNLPISIQEKFLKAQQFKIWKKQDYLQNAPQSVKEKIFEKYAIQDAPWIETGTFIGTTTNFLSQNYPKVYSIEPAEEFYIRAKDRFKGQNVELFNDISEYVLPDLLPKLNGSLNFWLDGHFSDGMTFKGDQNCPVTDELAAIEANLDRFDKVVIFIDDVRYFLEDDKTFPDYPSVNSLVDWARKNNFLWRIEHDIFIMNQS